MVESDDHKLRALPPHELLETGERDAIIRDVIEAKLTPRQKHVLDLRFGMTSGDPMTLDEVAEVVELTRERVRQIEGAALRRLRGSSEINTLDVNYTGSVTKRGVIYVPVPTQEKNISTVKKKRKQNANKGRPWTGKERSAYEKMKSSLDFKKCEYCGREFWPKSHRARFCKVTCMPSHTRRKTT